MRWAGVAGWMAGLVLVGGCRLTYTVPGEEIQRVRAGVQRGEAVVVQAREAKRGRPVRLILLPTDPVVRGQAGSAGEGEAADLRTLLDAAAAEGLTFEAPRPGKGKIIGGLSLFSAAWLASLCVAVGAEEPFYALPVVAPLYGAWRLMQFAGSDCRSDNSAYCGFAKPAAIALGLMSVSDGVLQVVGLVLSGLGFAELVEAGREVGGWNARPAPAVVPLGEGGAGLVVGGRF